jgi:hypothetical protein
MQDHSSVLRFFKAEFHEASVEKLGCCQRYRFFHPPLCPGAPPVERGAGPNSGPDWRESVGWKILLLLVALSSRGGLRVLARPGR